MNEDHPGIKVRPALVYFVGNIAIFILHAIVPLSIFSNGAPFLLGLAIIIVGFVPGILAARRMRAAGTTSNSSKASTAVVSDGVFGYSRNPIYVGSTLMLVGSGILTNSWWFVPVLLGVVLIMNTQVILIEEHYLEQKFGEDYLRYKASVRRWI